MSTWTFPRFRRRYEGLSLAPSMLFILTGKNHPPSSVGPSAVCVIQPRIRELVPVRHLLRHSGLDEAVRQRQAAFQRNWFRNV